MAIGVARFNPSSALLLKESRLVNCIVRALGSQRMLCPARACKIVNWQLAYLTNE